MNIFKQKRGLKLVLPNVLLLVFCVPLLAADITKIMPLGDSITRGWYGSDYDWGYRQPLYVSLTNDGFNFDFVGSRTDGGFADPEHEGHDGWRADEILNGRVSDPGAGKLEDWLYEHEPNIILLHIGTNDITVGNQDAEEVNDILDVIDVYESNSSTHVTVVLALIINRAIYSPATTAYNIDVNSMAQDRIASGDDIIVVNMENALNYSTDMADNLHPNDNGYVKMAGVWYNALVGYFNRKILTCSSTAGGSVTDPGEGMFRYDDGVEVNIVATADLYYHFVNWDGTAVVAGKVSDPNASSTIVTMDADYTVIANFATDNRMLTTSSTAGGSVIDPGEDSFSYPCGTEVNLVALADWDYNFIGWTGSAVDANKVANPDSISTIVAIDDDYTVTANFIRDKLGEVNQRLELTASGIHSDFLAFYNANGWGLDITKDFAAKVDFHYSSISAEEGWIGISIGDDVNHVSISVGSDSNDSYFYYEANVDGNTVSEQESRTADDGTLYISYDPNTKEFYLSHTEFGSENAHVWSPPDATQGQWSLPVAISFGGGSTGVTLTSGEAYLENFVMTEAALVHWPPATDIDLNGFVEMYDLDIICDNWLGSGDGDIDNNGNVDFFDYAEFGLAW